VTPASPSWLSPAAPAWPRSERLDEGAEAVTLAEGLGIPPEVGRGVAPAGSVLEAGVELHAA
jgi:hypothetical protein